MADTNNAAETPAPVPATKGRKKRRSFGFLRRGRKAVVRKAKGARMSYRNMYSRMKGRKRGVVRTMKSQGKGLVRYGKVALLWVAGGVTASLADTLLARAGLEDTPIGRFIVEVLIGAACIILGGPNLGAFGSGMILGAAGNLFHSEMKSLQETGRLDA